MNSFEAELFELVRKWTDNGSDPREMRAALQEQVSRLPTSGPATEVLGKDSAQ